VRGQALAYAGEIGAWTTLEKRMFAMDRKSASTPRTKIRARHRTSIVRIRVGRIRNRTSTVLTGQTLEYGRTLYGRISYTVDRADQIVSKALARERAVLDERQ